MFGISLKKYEELIKLGDKAPNSKRIHRLLLKPHKARFKVKTILDMTFAEFVDAERYLERGEYVKFCRIFVLKKWWQRVYFHNLEPIVKEYGRQKKEMTELYTFIYNPPVYGEPEKESIGSELRKDFVEQFGPYVIMMDKVMAWDKTGFKAIEQWKVSEFMFWCNYLTAQKITENVK